MLVKRALAGDCRAGLTELALGRRLYYAWEVLRHGAKWLGKPEPGAQPVGEPQPGARPSPEFPTPQQAMEDVIQDALEVGKRAFERHRPMIDRARARTLERLKEPRIGAAVIAGATLGAVASLGVLPTVLGASAAYMAHRKQASKRDAAATGGQQRD